MRFAVILFSLLLLACHALPATAAPGEFDRSFGQNGIATLPTETGSVAYFVTTDPIGRLLTTGKDQGNEFLARLLPNGGLDTSFNAVGYLRGTAGGTDGFGDTLLGHTGQWVSNLPGAQLLATRVDITSCRPEICRFRSQTIRARRFNADGSAVNAVNADVIVTAGFRPTQVVEQAAGGYLFITSVQGYYYPETQLARLGEDGLKDASFSANAKVWESCGNLPGNGPFRLSNGKALALAAGKTLLAQSISFLGGDVVFVCISRLNADGTLDQSYGSGGNLIFDSSLFNSYLRQPVALFSAGNGSIALVVQELPHLQSVDYRYLIVWLTAQGAVDTARPDKGITGPTDQPVAVVTAAAMQPDGKMLFAGYPAIRPADPNGGQQIDYSQPRVGRLLPQGGSDLTFGPGGQGFTPLVTFGKRLVPNQLHIAADGSIFIAGATADAGPVTVNEPTQFALGKLQGDPAPTQPAASQNGGGGGGGGCGITTDSRVDPVLPGLAMLALLSLWSRRRCAAYKN